MRKFGMVIAVVASVVVAAPAQAANIVQTADQAGTFKTLLAAAKAAGLESKEWDGFTLRTPPQGIDYNLLSRLDPIPTGGVSDMVVARDKGSILHVISKSLPTDGTAGEDTAQMRGQIAALNANVSRSLVYSDMIRDELIRSGLATEP